MVYRARLAKIKQGQAASISKRASHMGRKCYPFSDHRDGRHSTVLNNNCHRSRPQSRIRRNSIHRCSASMIPDLSILYRLISSHFVLLVSKLGATGAFDENGCKETCLKMPGKSCRASQYVVLAGAPKAEVMKCSRQSDENGMS